MDFFSATGVTEGTERSPWEFDMEFTASAVAWLCCWALMLILFVVGVMNLVWVAALTVFILIEKFSGTGARVARLGGVIMIVFGVFFVAT